MVWHYYLTCTFTAHMYILKHWKNTQTSLLLQRQMAKQINMKTSDKSKLLTSQINNLHWGIVHMTIFKPGNKKSPVA